MSNWIAITEDMLRATGQGAIIDSAKETASGVEADPIAEEINSVTARIRGAISTGNTLDVDPTKIPKSLSGLAKRMIVFALMERVLFELNTDQRDTRKNDNSYLLRINDDRLRFELPDNPAGSAEMQPGATFEVVTSQRRQNTREELRGI